jgi:hypothetical protein
VPPRTSSIVISDSRMTRKWLPRQRRMEPAVGRLFSVEGYGYTYENLSGRQASVRVRKVKTSLFDLWFVP